VEVKALTPEEFAFFKQGLEDAINGERCALVTDAYVDGYKNGLEISPRPHPRPPPLEPARSHFLVSWGSV
jgi:hypothetical protein